MLGLTISIAAIALAGVNVAAAPTPIVAANAHLAHRLNIRRDHTFKVIRRDQDCDESASASAAAAAPEVTGFNSTLAAYNGTISTNSSTNSTSYSGHSGYWSSQGASSEEEEECNDGDDDEEECDDDDDDDDDDDNVCPEGYEPVYEDDDDSTSSATATATSSTASATSTPGGEVVAAAYKGHHQKSSSSSPASTSTYTSAAAASSTGSSGGATGGVSGIATYFTQNGNPGACGNYNSDSTFLIAIRPEWYKNGENCGKTVSITAANGVTQQAIIADECPSCDTVDSIDMSTGLWDSFGYSTDAGIFDVTWTCDSCSAP